VSNPFERRTAYAKPRGGEDFLAGAAASVAFPALEIVFGCCVHDSEVDFLREIPPSAVFGFAMAPHGR
jgi:hypothetical protein